MKFNPRRFRKCKKFRETIGSGAVGLLQPPPRIFLKPRLKLNLYSLAQECFSVADEIKAQFNGSPLRGNCYAIILPKSLPAATFVMTRSQGAQPLDLSVRRTLIV